MTYGHPPWWWSNYDANMLSPFKEAGVNVMEQHLKFLEAQITVLQEQIAQLKETIQKWKPCKCGGNCSCQKS